VSKLCFVAVQAALAGDVFKFPCHLAGGAVRALVAGNSACLIIIRWAKTAARYHSNAQRAEVVELYERARAFYLEQVGAENEAGEGGGR
jgi:hypothetical protein